MAAVLYFHGCWSAWQMRNEKWEMANEKWEMANNQQIIYKQRKNYQQRKEQIITHQNKE